MASKIKVDQIEGSAGSSITIPSGQTLTITDGLASSTITSGTLADARIPNLNASKINAGTIPVARGGTGLASLGTANQVVAVNAGANALEFQNATSGSVPAVETFVGTQAFFSTSSTNNYIDVTALDTAITPSATSSKILLMVALDCAVDTFHYQSQFKIQRKIASGSFGDNVTNGYGVGDRNASSRASRSEDDSNGGNTMLGTFLDAPNTTSAVTYRIQVMSSSGGTLYLNRNSSNTSNGGNWQRAYGCKVIAIELKQ
jgi:hypothetical protein